MTPLTHASRVLDIRRLAASQGVAWWAEGWRLFAAAPLSWIGITVVFVIILIGLNLIVFIGSLAAQLLLPVLIGGLLLGCRSLDQGGAITIGHLFAGFSHRFGPLFILGLLLLAGSVGILAITFGIVFAMFGWSGLSMLSSDASLYNWSTLKAVFYAALIALLIMLLLFIPLVMAGWFAPALVLFDGLEPVAAMRASYSACVRNLLPFVVYAILGFGIALLATLPLGLGWIIAWPMTLGAYYASYKDIFGEATRVVAEVAVPAIP